jgi:hypothetical protein
VIPVQRCSLLVRRTEEGIRHAPREDLSSSVMDDERPGTAAGAFE